MNMQGKHIYGLSHSVAKFTMIVAMLLCSTLIRAQQTDSVCPPQTLPWATSFEVETRLPDCWSPMAEVMSYPYVYVGGYSSTGINSLALYAEGNGSCIAASPFLAYRADSLHIGFQLTMNDGYGYLQVGLVSDTADTSSFVAVFTLGLDTAALGYYEFYTDGFLSSDTEAVAFRIIEGRVTIDDLEVEVATQCRRPWRPQVGLVTHTTIALQWFSPGPYAATYLVRYINVSVPDTAYQTVYSNEVLLSGLSPATTYQIDVAALCGGDTTTWMPAGMVTTDVACRQPLSLEVEASTATAAVLHWNYDTSGYLLPNASVLSLYDIVAGSSAGSPNTISGDMAFLNNLTTGHRYLATVRAVCQTDTSLPLTIRFTPLADPCEEHSGNAASSSFPVNGTYRYNYTQMLYPKAILSGADTLYGIAFRVEENHMILPRMVELYIGQTDSGAFSGNIPSALMTLVCDSAVIPTGIDGWIDIPFDRPLRVDTAMNLVVAVLDNTGRHTTTIRFGTHVESYGGTLYTSSQTLPIPPDQFNIPMFSVSSVADIRLYGNCDMSVCQPPAAAVAGVTASGITVGRAGGSAIMAIRYRIEGADSWQAPLTTPSSSLTISPLNASTRYELQAASVCGTDTVYGRIFTATTACSSVGVPYTASFVDGPHPCWTGEQQHIADGVEIDFPIVSPEVNTVLTPLQVRLSLHTSTPSDIVRVGVTASDAAQVVWVDSVQASEIFDGEWIAYLDGYSGSGRHVAIQGDAGCLLQEAVIEPLDDCMPPRHVQVGTISASGATVSWSGTAASYLVYLYEEGGTTPASWTVSGNQFTFSGLAPLTYYEGYVVSVCGESASSRPARFRFSTDCGNIAYFPYEQGFEPDDATLACWTPVYADYACAVANPISTTSVRRFSGRQSLRFSSYNNTSMANYEQYFISPRIVTTDSIYLTFRYYKDNYDSEPFQVGFSPYGNSVDDFVWMGTIEPQAGQWMQYEIGFPATTRYVAINYIGLGNYYLYIDELKITGPGCAAPQITMVDEQAEEITLNWETSADTSYVAITQGPWLSNIEGTPVTASSYTFGSLQSGRQYTVGIRGRCSDGSLSNWITRRVVTISTECIAPTALAVDTVGFSDAVISWIPSGTEQAWQLSVVADGDLVYQSGRLTEPHCILTGLDQGRTYIVMVRALCSDIPGAWSAPLPLTTLECHTVSDLEYERVDFRTIILTWTDAPVTTGLCRIEYGTEGFTRGTGRIVDRVPSSQQLEYLDPYANYDIYVQNYCTPNVLSDSAAYIYVPTGVGIGDSPEPLLGLSIYPNPAAGDITVSVGSPAMLSVMDVSGRLVVQPTYTSSTFVIPHSLLPSGTYFVRLVRPDATEVGRLVVK